MSYKISIAVLVICTMSLLTIGYGQSIVPYRIGDKWGYAEYGTKKLIIPAQYDEANPFNGTTAAIKVFNKYGLIDNKGNLISELKYDDIEDANQGFYRFIIDDKYGFVNGIKAVFK